MADGINTERGFDEALVRIANSDQPFEFNPADHGSLDMLNRL